MRALVRPAGRLSQSILLLALLQGAIVSLLNSSSTCTVSATRFHVREEKLQESMPRHRKLFQKLDSPSDHEEQELMSETSEKREDELEKHAGNTPALEEIELHAAIHNDAKSEALQQFREGSEPQYSDSEITEEEGERDTRMKTKERKKSEEKQKRRKKRTKENHSQSDEYQNELEESKTNAGLNSEAQEPEEEKDDNNADTEEQIKTEEHPVAEKSQEEVEANSVQESEQTVLKEEEKRDTELESKTDKETKIGTSEELETSSEENSSENDDQLEQSVQDESKAEEKQQEEDEQHITEDETEEEKPFVFPNPYLIGPTINDWDQQRESWLEANPNMNTTPDGKPRVLIVTGSQPEPCRSPLGDNFHIKSLKLKIDYARMHNYEIYYNFAWLDPLFGTYWVKLPIVRKLMLTHPEIEWFFWVDSDAVFTDMLFEAPFHTYEGFNMIMWGWEYGFFTKKSWTAFNAGVFILRNCQWSLDLIDKWSPMGPDGPVRNEYGKILTSFLSNRDENYPADDQSALAYLILTDEAVSSKVKLIELTEYMVSAWWIEVVDNYETSIEKYHPGLGDERWPWITHFTGCGPCGGDESNADYQKCIHNIERAFNFADNQVLAYMGFQHESLSSSTIFRTRNETDQPLQFLGLNPWEERIAEVAAAAAAA